MSVFYTSKENAYDSSVSNDNEKFNLHKIPYKDKNYNNLAYNDSKLLSSHGKQAYLKARPSTALKYNLTEEDENSIRYLMFYDENRDRVTKAYLKCNRNIIEAERYLKEIRQRAIYEAKLVNENLTSEQDSSLLISDSSSTEKGICIQAELDSKIQSRLQNLQAEKKMIKKKQKDAIVKLKASKKKVRVFEERVIHEKKQVYEQKMIRSTSKNLRESLEKQFTNGNKSTDGRYNYKIPEKNKTESFNPTFETESTPLKDSYSNFSKNYADASKLSEKIQKVKLRRFNLSANPKLTNNYSSLSESNSMQKPIRPRERQRYLQSNTMLRDKEQISTQFNDSDPTSYDNSNETCTIQTDDISVTTPSNLKKVEILLEQKFKQLEEEKFELQVSKMKLEEKKVKIFSKRSENGKERVSPDKSMSRSNFLQNDDIALRANLIYIDNNEELQNTYINDQQISDEWNLTNKHLNQNENQQKIKIRNGQNLNKYGAHKQLGTQSPNLKHSQFIYKKSDISEARTDLSAKGSAYNQSSSSKRDSRSYGSKRDNQSYGSKRDNQSYGSKRDNQSYGSKRENLSGKKSRNLIESDISNVKEYERSLNDQKSGSIDTEKSSLPVNYFFNEIE